MLSVGIVANLEKKNARLQMDEIHSWLLEQGAKVYLPDLPYDVTDSHLLYTFLQNVFKELDVVLVLGGDGTLLLTARQAAHFGLPLLGINMGRVGFLAELEPGEELYHALKRLLRNDYILEARMMILATVIREGREIASYHCLNDAVFLRNHLSGLVNLSVLIDGKECTSYHGDGLIVATPTGASGYSLSAAGPLISPEMESIAITPICPQSLYSRSMVIGPDRTVTVSIYDPDAECILAIDGKTETLPLLPGDTINVCRSAMKTQFIRLNDKNFFDVLNEKLRGRR